MTPAAAPASCGGCDAATRVDAGRAHASFGGQRAEAAAPAVGEGSPPPDAWTATVTLTSPRRASLPASSRCRCPGDEELEAEEDGPRESLAQAPVGRVPAWRHGGSTPAHSSGVSEFRRSDRRRCDLVRGIAFESRLGLSRTLPGRVCLDVLESGWRVATCLCLCVFARRLRSIDRGVISMALATRPARCLPGGCSMLDRPSLRASASSARLSVSELAALALAADGFTAPERARPIYKSPATVKTQRSQVLLKLGARNMTHAVGIAFHSGLIPQKAA